MSTSLVSRAGRPAVGVRTVVAAVVVGLLTAWFVVTVKDLEGTMRSLVVAVPFGVAAGAFAVVKYEWFLLGLLTIRPLLDVFDAGWQGGGVLDPAAAVAILVIVTGLAWLAAQWSVGALVRPAAPTIALWTLVVAALASVVVSSDVGGSLEWNIRLIAGVVVFTLVEQLLAQRPAFAVPLVVAVIASAVIPILIAFLQGLAGGEPAADGASRVRSTFVHPNPFATYLVTVLLLCIALVTVLRGPRRMVLVGVAIGAGIALVLTQARGAWAACVVGLLLLGMKLERRIVWGLVVAIGAAIVLMPSAVARIQNLTEERYTGTAPSNSLEWRLGYWGELVSSSGGSQRITGIGLEEVQRTASERLQPHNVFVQTYVELGAFGVGALVAVLGTMTIYLLTRAREAREPVEVALAWAACAVALALVVQFVSENLLTNVSAYWYAAAAMTYGYAATSREADEPPGVASNGNGYSPAMTAAGAARAT